MTTIGIIGAGEVGTHVARAEVKSANSRRHLTDVSPPQDSNYVAAYHRRVYDYEIAAL
ncbi:hypothetical protein GO308_00235 [Sphingomonas sp. SFZ2018-12]|uniref:hypothetical protein n=1 Tax=Sphingomonas sp. SFZ2018-12 TaxID=2683197 RepID=UPI001F0D6602|nr:hypothetical protein [Sphingomonas sp. SFZ2018-12]MCH4891533.1 hypothetical protein [Sphingomonas sp. SFZ2018-12]